MARRYRQAGVALVLALPAFAQQARHDLREAYDVRSYRLDLKVEPDEKRLSGTVGVEAEVTADSLTTFDLDMNRVLKPSRVVLFAGPIGSNSAMSGEAVEFTHEKNRLRCNLGKRYRRGDVVRLAVTYSGSPRGRGFSGFHWARTADGRPWINTSCQGPGAHSWWPCKASYFHPEDKPDRIWVNLDVPAGLYGVSNGVLLGRDKKGDRETFRWAHGYPLETYTVTLNVAPYVVVEQKLELEGIADPVPFVYYVLPENAAKAKVQFAQVPEMLRVFGKAFGPFPFPKSKFGLVETNFWGMEHSTAIAYGSSYPLWCKQNGERDRYRSRNRFFDYILVHESAHEWWGNAVSASDWGHFWVHEGFGTYAEGVYVELTQGRAKADRYFASIEGMATGRGTRLYRGKDVNSGQAYSAGIYYKGAWVLNTLRHYVADDDVWWKTLRDFNMEFRFKNAVTEDFQKILERNSGRSFERFFKQWFYGAGAPRLRGSVTVEGNAIVVDVDNTPEGEAGFHVPLDLAWSEGVEPGKPGTGKPRKRRLMLAPGKNELRVECGAAPSGVEVVHLQRVLGRHRVVVE